MTGHKSHMYYWQPIGPSHLQEGVYASVFYGMIHHMVTRVAVGTNNKIYHFLLVTTRIIAHPGGVPASEFVLISWIWTLGSPW